MPLPLLVRDHLGSQDRPPEREHRDAEHYVPATPRDAAEQASLRLTPPDLATSPVAFRRVDGTSVFRPKHSTLFSSELLLAAEDRLLDRSRTMTGPTVPVATVEKITARPDAEGRMLGEDQADALMKIAMSGCVLDVLVGPAGAGKLRHGRTLSAHETITAEHEQWGSIAQLAAEYETIAAAAQRDRWASLIRASGLTAEQADAVVESEAFGALTAELRRAEANHHDVDTLFPRLATARGFEDADDIASVLHYRVARATARPAGSGRTRKAPRLIAGLVPHADGPMTGDMRHALDERRELIEARADAVLDTARETGEAWTRPLGAPPRDPRKAQTWRRYVRTVAAYRDRYGITEDSPLGPTPESTVQKIDRARAEAALRQLAGRPAPRQQHRPPAPARQGPSL